jgi:hypothetical protein
MKSKIIATTIIILSILISVQYTWRSRSLSNQQSKTLNLTPTTSISKTDVATSYDIAQSLEEVIKGSTVIVIGELQEKGETINMARDIDNPAKPSSRIFIIGQVYNFQVKIYLKGSGSDVIEVVQPEGVINTSASSITREQIEQAQLFDVSYGTTPFIAGNEYILLLEPLDASDKRNAYLTGSIHPWRFVVSPNGDILTDAPEQVVREIGLNFSPLSMTEFLSKVSQIVQEN